jgi:DNA modification methylase
VLDPFGGSGTTGVVAQEEDRKAILVELNPGYNELAKKRLKHSQRKLNFT